MFVPLWGHAHRGCALFLHADHPEGPWRGAPCREGVLLSTGDTHPSLCSQPHRRHALSLTLTSRWYLVANCVRDVPPAPR